MLDGGATQPPRRLLPCLAMPLSAHLWRPPWSPAVQAGQPAGRFAILSVLATWKIADTTSIKVSIRVLHQFLFLIFCYNL